jgi:phosphate:Na+ symporter
MWFDIALAILPGIILFLYGIEHFSSEILKVSGEKFRKLIKNLTKTPARGLISGALSTAVIQSSTATTIIALGLVNAGVLSFSNSLGVIFGANIGTAITAHLIAFKITFFAPFLIILGFIISLIGGKYKFLGKPVFYFGLVFFSLNLISTSLVFLQDAPEILMLFDYLSNVFIAIGVGILLTILFQSSSVTTGLAIVFTLNGIIGFEHALPIVLGSNVGTTATSLIASRTMDLFSRRAAMAHFLFNVLGLLLILPFLSSLIDVMNYIGGDPALKVANAHLIFNLCAGIFFILILKYFKRLIEYLVKGEEKEILLNTKYLNDILPESNEEAFELIGNELKYNLEISNEIFNISMNAIKTNVNSIPKIEKLETLTDILDDRISVSLLELSKRELNEDEAERIIKYSRISNSIEQLADICKRLNLTHYEYFQKGLAFEPDTLIEFETNHLLLSKNFLLLNQCLPNKNENNEEFVKNYNTLFKTVNLNYKFHIKRMAQKQTLSGSYFVEGMAILENINDKLLELNRLTNI